MKKSGFVLLILVDIVFLLSFSCKKKTDDNEISILIIQPQDGDSISLGSEIVIKASVKNANSIDNDVTFYINNDKKETLSTAPYTFKWKTDSLLKGIYTLKASLNNNGTNYLSTIKVKLINTIPEADFKESRRIITEGCIVCFFDKSLNSPDSWQWDFGDGINSTEQNPNHKYNNAGTYSVSLKLTNNKGDNKITKADLIVVSSLQNGDCPAVVTDYDGNSYQTIKLGNQCWMAENIKTTHYSDGTPISYIQDTSDWNNMHFENDAYCLYLDHLTNDTMDHVLYSYNAAMNNDNYSYNNPSGVQGVCPVGWHIPSDEEWKELEIFLGMTQLQADSIDFRGTNEGSKLAGSYDLWEYGILKNNPSFNESGFNAKPNGYRNENGHFGYFRFLEAWWSTSQIYSNYAYIRMLSYTDPKINRTYYYKKHAFSVRCIKD